MEKNISQLNAKLESANSVQERVDALNALAWALRRNATDRERSTALSTEAVHLSEDKENFDPPYYDGIVAGMTAQAAVHMYRGSEEFFPLSFKALALAEKHHLTTPMPRLLYLMGVTHTDLGDLPTALNYLVRQQAVSEELDDKEGIALGLWALTALYGRQGDHENGLKSCLKGIEAFRISGDTYGIVSQLGNLSEAYIEIGDRDNALSAALEALNTYRSSGIVYPRMESNILRQVGQAYINLQQYDKAKPYLEESLALTEKSNDQDEYISVRLTFANLFNTLEQPERAILYANTAIELAAKHNYPLLLYDGHKALSDSYHLLGNYAKALEHYKTFHKLREKVFSTQNSDKLRTLKILHHTQEMQKEAEYFESLYQVEQDHRHKAEILNQVGQVLNGSLELNHVLDHILEQLGSLLHFDRGGVLLLHDMTFEFVAVHGYPEGRSPLHYQIPVDTDDKKSMLAHVSESKRPLILTDLHTNPIWFRMFDLAVPDIWLIVPLIYHDEIIGILSLARTTNTPYTDDEITLAMTFAAQASVALENARLYAQISQMNEHLEDTVRIRTEDLRVANEKLTELNRTKSDFITITAHELRTPVTILKGYGELLQYDPAIIENEQQSRMVNGIVNGANRMESVVNRMLLMVKIDSHQLDIDPEPLIAHTLLRDTVKAIEADLNGRSLTFTLDDELMQLPSFEADKRILKTLFNNLLLNAVKYTPDGGSIHIHGNSWTKAPAANPYGYTLPEQAVELIITDTGIGIDESALHLIFGKMYQTGEVASHSSGTNKFKGGGSGLGLAIARGIVRAHGGCIWAESEGYDEKKLMGSSFHIVLPLVQEHGE